MDYLTHHMLQTSAKRSPEKEALVHGVERLTYGAIASKTAGLASGLCSAGISLGDRIGIYLDASVQQVLSIFGISEAGGVFVPINATLFPEQVAHVAKDCGMRALITNRNKLNSLLEILSQIPTLEFLVLTDGGEFPAVQLPIHSFQDFCALAPLPANRKEPISKDLGAILYTSGSTGKPKGVMLSHANIMAGSRIVSTYLGITSAERILAVFRSASTLA